MAVPPLPWIVSTTSRSWRIVTSRLHLRRLWNVLHLTPAWMWQVRLDSPVHPAHQEVPVLPDRLGPQVPLAVPVSTVPAVRPDPPDQPAPAVLLVVPVPPDRTALQALPHLLALPAPRARPEIPALQALQALLALQVPPVHLPQALPALQVRLVA